MFRYAPLLSLSLASVALAQTYSATYLPSNTPKQSEQGQTGTNQCGSGHDQNSMCQNAYLNSLDDWCIFAPPQPGANSTIGDTERIEVAWCTKDGHGTRLIPDGTITGAHFVQTPDYVQVTGVGDLTKINIPAGDEGGELDPHGADGNGNPIGGLVFSNAFTGQYQQLHEWTNFVSDSEFCFRGCKDGPNAPALCQHIYDVMGCEWNMPGNYAAGSFDKCLGDTGEPMGVYGTSTFHQGDPSTPPAHPAPSTSSCTTTSTISNGVAAANASGSGSSSGSVSATTTNSASATNSASVSGSSSPSSGGASASGSGPVETTASGGSSGVSGSGSGTSSRTISTAPPIPSGSTGSRTGSTTPSATGGSSNNNAAGALRIPGVELVIAGAAVVLGAAFVA
ncbi:hypothetical protein BN946_scf184844.g127 [Trametes cinnabarina]|uniref:Carbohydrate-Binding Module Family 13 protein n=1 Tax=Pycnoporus cinnabarinus TaxID=5643 RepID=A0A060SFE5_PYCCI|nr:hypothetical protein BN946_scf184844.g127 [Trametes cinnabarina]